MQASQSQSASVGASNGSANEAQKSGSDPFTAKEKRNVNGSGNVSANKPAVPMPILHTEISADSPKQDNATRLDQLLNATPFIPTTSPPVADGFRGQSHRQLKSDGEESADGGGAAHSSAAISVGSSAATVLFAQNRQQESDGTGVPVPGASAVCAESSVPSSAAAVVDAGAVDVVVADVAAEGAAS